MTRVVTELRMVANPRSCLGCSNFVRREQGWL